MKLTEAKLKKLIRESMSESYYDSKYRTSEPGEHDKILGLIQSGNWAQAFEFLEMGVAKEWPEDAKTDLVWDIYEGLEEFHQKNIRPLERLIDRYETRNNPFVSKSANVPTQEEVDGLRARVTQLEEEEKKLKLLVADLLGFPEDWWENRGEYDMDWEDNFKNAGII